jgi:hypothetical protein
MGLSSDAYKLSELSKVTRLLGSPRQGFTRKRRNTTLTR